MSSTRILLGIKTQIQEFTVRTNYVKMILPQTRMWETLLEILTVKAAHQGGAPQETHTLCQTVPKCLIDQVLSAVEQGQRLHRLLSHVHVLPSQLVIHFGLVLLIVKQLQIQLYMYLYMKPQSSIDHFIKKEIQFISLLI